MNIPLDGTVRRGRPARSHDQLGQTRDALIRSGMELLTAQGFGATGVETILGRLGIPKGSFYHYFPSKEGFGKEVLSAYNAYILRKLDRWLADDSRDAMQRLLDFIADAKAGIRRHRYERGCLVGNLGQEVTTLPDGFRELLDSVLRDWQQRVALCLKQGQVSGVVAADLDCDELAAFFWIGWEGAVLRSRLERSAKALDTFSTAFVRLIRP